MPEGIKFDGDKARLAEMILDFKEPMEELCKVWTFGAFKYTKSNWKQLDNGIDRYTNALLRHLFAEQDNIYDDETHLYHAAHIAFNALARLYFIMKSKPEEQYEQLKLDLDLEDSFAPSSIYEIPAEEAKYTYGSRCE